MLEALDVAASLDIGWSEFVVVGSAARKRRKWKTRLSITL